MELLFLIVPVVLFFYLVIGALISERWYHKRLILNSHPKSCIIKKKMTQMTLFWLFFFPYIKLRRKIGTS